MHQPAAHGGQRIEADPDIHWQLVCVRASSRWEDILMAGDRQQNEKDVLGIAGQPLDGCRVARVGLEL